MQMLLSRRKFGYREVGLFRLIDHRVATPQGPGILLSVFRSNCCIPLERTGSVVLCPPLELIKLMIVNEFTAAGVAA